MSNDASAVIRLALIGSGRWGKNFIRTIRGLKDVVLSVLCSRNPDSSKLVDSRCRILHDWHDLLGSNLCDGVIIATPPETHAEILRTMIRARMPALVEKPLTLDLQEARDLQQLLRQSPTPVLVDHIYLFHPAYIELKRLSPDLGRIHSIQSVGGNYGPFRPNYSALWDYGSHDIAMCLHLLGQSPQTVTCRAREESPGGEYQLDLEFAEGVSASILVSNIMKEKRRQFTVRFEKHILVFDDLSAQKLVLDGNPVFVDQASPLSCAVETFVDGIRGKPIPTLGLDLALDVIRTLDRAQRALTR